MVNLLKCNVEETYDCNVYKFFGNTNMLVTFYTETTLLKGKSGNSPRTN